MGKPTSGGAGGSGGRVRNQGAAAAAAAAPETYREFSSDSEMKAYLYELWNEQMEGVSNLARDAQDSYKTYSKINDELRREEDNFPFYWNNPRPRTRETKTVGEVAAALDTTMRPSKENLVLWRGISDMPSIASGLRNGTLVGTTIDDKAFISTSTGRDATGVFSEGYQQNIVIKLFAKKGTKMAAADQDYNWSGGQREIIVARNSRLRITKVVSVSSNSRKIELEAEIIQ